MSSSTIIESVQPPMVSQSFGEGSLSSLQITCHKLDGKNFLQWSRSVLLVIRGRGKIGYLNGEVQRPEVNDSSYANWELTNSIVMAWLINSMEPQISRTYLFLRTAKAIWDAVNRNYSDLENASQVFEIKNKLKELRQGTMEVTEYYNELQILWQELDLHYEADWGDLDESLKFRRHLEKERLYEVLTGLNRDLDEVRSRILGRRPLPPIDEAFAEVCREASRKRVMLGEKKDVAPITVSGDRPIETSALAVRSVPYRSNEDKRKGGRPWCNHCNRNGHTRDTCWDIHGKPTNWKPKGARETNRAKVFKASIERKMEENQENDGVFLNKSLIEQLQNLLSQPKGSNSNAIGSSSGGAISNFAQKSTVFHSIPWMFDSGASDHMTVIDPSSFPTLHVMEISKSRWLMVAILLLLESGQLVFQILSQFIQFCTFQT
ncbi:Retrotransposon gag domain-containing protein [Dioscorea alata]|uniref:Retrotransposon gag domain-containing protein n=1 Tax=Dioscorea alata TaxID=55571 RepID=A0ACB7WL73_DIOAL|nr:Retrotransposon gag domain-containing protein [Dioscorea alata]